MSLWKQLEANDSRITSLVIHENKLATLEYLPKNTCVTKLILYGNITDVHVAKISQTSSIKELVIGNIINDSYSLINIGDLIASQKYLCHLKLIDGKYNHIRTLFPGNYLIDWFSRFPSTELKRIPVALTKFTYEKTQDVQSDEVERIYGSLMHITTLKSLCIKTIDDLSVGTIDNGTHRGKFSDLVRWDPSHMFNWMKVNKTIQTLHLAFKDSYVRLGFSLIMGALASDTVIKYVTLEVSRISYNCLARLINCNTTIKKLDIHTNCKTYESEQHLQDHTLSAIRHNTTLISLNIPYNFIHLPPENELRFLDEINRMCTINRWKFALFDICVAFRPLGLPPYVILEIFDQLPYMDQVNHVLKIRLIQQLLIAFRSKN